MNMVRLRQILASRRANKQPPLIPLRREKQGSFDIDTSKRISREILDISIQLKNFPTKYHKKGSIICTFSEIDELQPGSWKMTAAVEVPPNSSAFVDIPSAFAIEFQFERPQLIRLDICDLSITKAISCGCGYFLLSELVTVPLDEGISRKIINDESNEEIAVAKISSTLRQKSHAVLVQFCAKSLVRKGLSTNSQIFFEVSKNLPEMETPLYRSEGIKFNSGRIVWRSFTLPSEEIASEINFKCYYRDNANQNQPVDLGGFQTTYENLKHGAGPRNSYFLIYEGSKGQMKSCGIFELLRITQISTPTFLEFVASGLTLNLAVAVDFSRPGGNVEENIIRQFIEDVEISISAFCETLQDFSPNAFAGFGFGAKVPPMFRESQEFCLNLDNNDTYCNGLEGLLSAFRKSFANVQPINTAHLSHVIYYVAKLAQNMLTRFQTSASHSEGAFPPYFVLVMITRGVFDDLKETVQAIIFASRLPISIIFVGIDDGVSNLGELERLATAKTRLNYHGRKPERDCISYSSLKVCRSPGISKADLKAVVAEQGLVNIPAQICTWFNRNGYKPNLINQSLDDEDHKSKTASARQLPTAKNSPEQNEITNARPNVFKAAATATATRELASFPDDNEEGLTRIGAGGGLKSPNETTRSDGRTHHINEEFEIPFEAFGSHHNSCSSHKSSDTMDLLIDSVRATNIKQDLDKVSIHSFPQYASTSRRSENLVVNSEILQRTRASCVAGNSSCSDNMWSNSPTPNSAYANNYGKSKTYGQFPFYPLNK